MKRVLHSYYNDPNAGWNLVLDWLVQEIFVSLTQNDTNLCYVKKSQTKFIQVEGEFPLCLYNGFFYLMLQTIQ